MREPVRKKIGDVTFDVTPLGFKKGRQAFVRLSKAIGPALAKAAADAPDLKSMTDAGMLGAIDALVERVNDDELEWFAETFGAQTRFSRGGDRWPDLNSANRESLFAGNLAMFFQWLAFACEVNFADFLELLKGAAKGADPSASSPKEAE